MNLRGGPNGDRGVVVTGLGVVSAVGVGVTAFGQNLFAGHSGISLIRSFDASRFRCRIGAEIPEIDFSRHLEAKEIKLLDRLSLLTIAAADEAIADAGLDLERDRAALGVIVGTGLGPSAGIEDCVRRVATEQRLRPTTLLRVMLSSPAATLCQRYRSREVSHVHVTACAASAHALAQAADYIRRGELDLCLVVGCDAFPSEAAFASWDALGVMSPDNHDPKTASRPFSADRSGIVIGEAAAALVMESEGRARARAVRIHGRLTGSGSTSHAPNLTQPSVEGMSAAMARALDRAGLVPEQVGYINAHGTGTGMNDALETQALHQVFGAHAARLRISSTKAAHGHVMGASGALEAVATILSLREGIAAPTLNLRQPDPACDLDYTPNVARPMDCSAALSNSFAFGGHYVSLVFAKEEPSL
jgi:3-oxoacyl-(acyl-carrier-protein) synthase